MATNSPIASLPIPSLTDPPNAPTAFQGLANALDPIVIPRFNSAAARDVKIPAPTDGQHAFLTDSHALVVYKADRAAWVPYSYALSPQVDVYSTVGSTIWTKPTGARSVWVRVLGGGGGGGGAVGGTGTACGGSGGAGGYAESWYDASVLAASVSVAVGQGGSVTAGGAGNTGGASSFGALMTANGGGGGQAGPNATGASSANPGPGGTASGGNIVSAQGEFGATGRVSATQEHSFFQRGASSPFGSGGAAALSVSGNGDAASGFGAGGGNAIASTTSRSGGVGSKGLVIVVTFF